MTYTSLSHSKILENLDLLKFSHPPKVFNLVTIYQNITLVEVASVFDRHIHGVFTSVCRIDSGDE